MQAGPTDWATELKVAKISGHFEGQAMNTAIIGIINVGEMLPTVIPTDDRYTVGKVPVNCQACEDEKGSQLSTQVQTDYEYKLDSFFYFVQ